MSSSANVVSCLGVFVGAIVLVALALITYSVYYDTLISYYNILSSEEYSYLIIALVLVAYITYSALSSATLEYEIKLNKILLFITLLVFSTTLYIVSYLNPLYRLSLQILSYILLLFSFFILFYRPSRYRYKIYLILVTALFLIPVPRNFLDYASMELSRTVGFLAARITSLPYVVRSGRVFISVVDASGVTRIFEIGYLCSGIVSISSILALLPLITYFICGSRLSVLKKAMYIALYTAIGLAIVFFGNLLRVLAILLITKNYGYQLALNFFHSTPALIYTGVATSIIMYLIYRSVIRTNLYSVYKVVESRIPPLSTGIVRSISVYLVIALIGTAACLTLTTPSIGGSFKQEQVFYDVSDVINNPFKIILKNTTYRDLWYRPYELKMATPISSLKIYYIRINVKGSSYIGYLEIADSPNKFHSWLICLTYQGYNIESYWLVHRSDTSLSFMITERNGYRYLLGYILYKLKVLVGGVIEPLYIRVTLFHPYISGKFDEITENLEDILLSLNPYGGEDSKESINYALYILIVQAVIVIDIIYIIVYVLRHSVEKLKRITRSLGGS